MTRRGLLQGILAAGVWNGLLGRAGAAQPASMKAVEDLQKNWKMLLAAGAKVPLPGEPLKLSNDEWRKRLDRMAYHVLREEGTERAGTSPLNNEKRPGIFACAGCDLPLFTSEMKYESGTGWPSFFTTIPGVFATKKDYALFLPRIEYHCVRCGGHHGHVFDDGPPPTGQRWCNNGAALRFIPKTGKA
jgi:peptide-methionine (R)-S-oxide reductase